MTNYIVQAGDNLTKIARAHGTTVENLKELNNIKDVNKISIGQELSLGRTQEPEMTQNAVNKQNETDTMVGMDSFVPQNSNQQTVSSDQQNQTSPFLIGAAGALTYGAAEKTLPHLTKISKTTYMKAATGTKDAYAKMQASAKGNAKAVRNFVAQKAKHVAKSAELHYAFGKDAVKKGASNVVNKTKTTTKKVADKAKTTGRYTRFIGNTKVAPKLIKCTSKFAAPLALLYGTYEVKSAYDKGGIDAAAKQAIKTGGGLAGGWAGAKIGASIGAVAGPIGAVVGGIIGGVGGYLLGEKIFS